MTGKTIRIFLADGEPTGILLAEISNWTGKVLVAPRSQLDQLRHNKNEAKDFWERTVVIVSKDENLTKSHVRYLESRLIKLAQDAHRAKLTNDTAPDPTKLPESDEADMEAFLAEVQMVLPVLGFDFTQPKPTAASAKPTSDISPVFVLKRVGIEAAAQEIDGQFIVLVGSTMRAVVKASGHPYVARRKQLLQDGVIEPASDSTCLRLTEDVPFASPSAAASLLMGSSVNGRKNWKVKATGQTYAQWQDAKLAALGVDVTAADDDDDDHDEPNSS